MSDFVESEAEESEEEYNEDGEVVPRVAKKLVEEDDDGESSRLPRAQHRLQSSQHALHWHRLFLVPVLCTGGFQHQRAREKEALVLSLACPEAA